MLEYCTFYFKNAIKRLLQAEATSKMLKYTITEEKNPKQLFFFFLSKSLSLNARSSQIIRVGDLPVFFPPSFLF